MSLQADGRFQVIGLNQRRLTSMGGTDADLVFRHVSTGLQGRMEVKNLSLSSQRSNLPEIQKQILKMPEDARFTGEIQVWGNPRSILPEIRVFAERHGITVAERLRTGSTNLRPEDLRFGEFAGPARPAIPYTGARLIASFGEALLAVGNGRISRVSSVPTVEDGHCGISW